jgi:DNA-binding XRE family transcriptional regulator
MLTTGCFCEGEAMKRNIGQEILDGLEAIKTDGGVHHAVEAPGRSTTLEDFFSKHYQGQTEAAVSLRGYRYREDLTQKQFADLAGIPQRHISEMETGKRPIGKERAKKLAKVLNADYRMLL